MLEPAGTAEIRGMKVDATKKGRRRIVVSREEKREERQEARQSAEKREEGKIVRR